MNLRKDAWVAVSLAGAVLVTAGISTRMAQKPADQVDLPKLGQAAFDSEVFEVYRQASRAHEQTVPVARVHTLAPFRSKMLGLYNSRRLKSPLDLYRIAAVLGSSEDPQELAVAHRLSVEALAGGVQEARNVVFQTQDCLLLSLGEKQRYGTQRQWQGRDLGPTGDISPDLPGSLRNRLGLIPRAQAATTN